MVPDLHRLWSEKLCNQQQSINQVAGVSHILGFMQSCHQLEICAKQRSLLQNQIQLGIKVKVQL